MQATLTRAPLLNGCLDPGDVSVQEAYGARPCGRHRPAVNAVAHLPRFVLAGEQLDIAIRGGLIACDASPAPAIATTDEAGDLVGILQRHESGRFRLKPNFRGLG